MLPPLPRCSNWAYSSLISPSHISLPRKGCRVGLHIDLFEDCSAFTRVAACTLARSPIRDPLSEGFRHFVTSMPAPVASGWSGCRVGLAPTGKRRLVTAHTRSGRSARSARPAALGRVEVWRGGFRSNISVAAPFVWRCLTGSTVAPFPHPAHRTGHADLPHPALGQDVTPSPTTGPDQAVRGVRAGSARKGARGDNSRPCVA